MPPALDGKVALITGAGRGLGAATARTFAERGARVIVADVTSGSAQAVTDELGESARFAQLDVTVGEDWAAAVANVMVEFGRLDVLVNNAGVWHARDLMDESPASFETVFRINTVGPLLGMQACVPAMAGSGAVINVCSTAGLAGYPGQGAYGASKWALRGLSRVAAAEFAPVRVNSVCPGLIATPMIEEAVDVNGPLDHILLRRAARSEEVAALVAFLASDEAAYVTGSEYVIDGGSLGPAA